MTRKGGQMHSYLSFTVGPLTLGVDMTSVVSIDQGSPEHAGRHTELRLGSVFYAGEAVPLYSAPLLFGAGGSCQDVSHGAKTVILRLENGAIGLSVDRVGKVMEGPDADMAEMPPVFTGIAKALFPRALHGAEGWIPLLCPDAVEQAAFSVVLNPVDVDADVCVSEESPVLADEPAFEVDVAAMAGCVDGPFEDGVLEDPVADEPEAVLAQDEELAVDRVEPPDSLPPDPLSHELGSAITPGLLEKVVRRVVKGMMAAVVSELVTGSKEEMGT